MEEWVLLLREFGFPVFVVIWFMFRTEKILKANTQALTELREVIRNGRRK